MEAVTRLERLGLARTLRVVVVARLARCAWWLWLGSHAATSAVCALTPRTRLHFSAAPENLFMKWLPQNLPRPPPHGGHERAQGRGGHPSPLLRLVY